MTSGTSALRQPLTLVLTGGTGILVQKDKQNISQIGNMTAIEV
jgi:hypothetical protein